MRITDGECIVHNDFYIVFSKGNRRVIDHTMWSFTECTYSRDQIVPISRKWECRLHILKGMIPKDMLVVNLSDLFIANSRWSMTAWVARELRWAINFNHIRHWKCYGVHQPGSFFILPHYRKALKVLAQWTSTFLGAIEDTDGSDACSEMDAPEWCLSLHSGDAVQWNDELYVYSDNVRRVSLV